MADITVMKTDGNANQPNTSYRSYTIVADSTAWRALTLDGRYQWYVMHNGVASDGTTAANGLIVLSLAQTVAIDCTEEPDKVVLLGGTAIYRAIPIPRIESSSDCVWNFKAKSGSPSFQLLRGAYVGDGSGQGS